MKINFKYCLLMLCLAATAMTAQAGVYEDLLVAAARDDTDAVVALLDRGMDVNSVDPSGNTLLHLAAKSGNIKLVDALLKRRANTSARNKLGETALMLAAYNGKLDAASSLVAAGAELNPKGWTPLHYAVFAGNEDIVALLLKKNAQVDARAPNEQTALMLAARQGSVEIARLLLQAKANRNLQDQYGETALMIAQKAGNNDIANLIEGKPTRAEAIRTNRVPAAEDYVSPPFQVAPKP